MNNVLLQNIQGSRYFKKDLYSLKTVDQVIDEIFYKVKHVCPWEKNTRNHQVKGMNAGVRGISQGGLASSGFCLLWKLFTLKPSKHDLEKILYHRDSVYIRAIGLLFVRLCVKPSSYLDWISDCLTDDTDIPNIKPAHQGNPRDNTTLGAYTQDLFSSNLKYHDTIMPRIPITVLKDIKSTVEDEQDADEKYGGDWGDLIEEHRERERSPHRNSRY